MKPIIGVTPDFNPGDRQDMGGPEPTYFLRDRYLKAIEVHGGIPVILPLISDTKVLRRILEGLHGLMVTGSGSDLAPGHYRERQRFPFRKMSPQRANMELALCKLGYQRDMPLLGICGGMQSINVAMGGTLYQDIAGQIPNALPHLPSHSATEPAHAIHIAPDGILRRIMRKRSIQVNSSHHQSVKRVAPRFISTAVSPDGVIEAIEAPTRQFFLGVQWHPEFLFDHDPFQTRLFRAFIKAAKQNIF